MSTVVNQAGKIPAYLEYIVRIHSAPKDKKSNTKRFKLEKEVIC